MISLLAVCAALAVSAVGATAASAQCLKVAVAGTGTFEKSTCAGAAGTKEYIKAKTVTEIKSGEWCAKVEEPKTGTYKNAACTEAEAKGEYIKVIAACYPVAVAGTGNYASSKKCEERVASTPAEWVAIEKLEKEIKPGEWCAKVKAGEPSTYKNNTCTEAKAGTGEFTKVKESLDEWEVCEKGGTEEWSEHKCNAGKGTGEWSWKVLAAGKSYPVTSKKVAGSAPEVLTIGTKKISCTEVTNKGTITGGQPGTDLASTITFTGCTTGQAGCLVKSAGQANGTIVLTNIPTKLEQRLVGEEEILVDNFEQNVTTKEFVTLKFEAEAGKSCSEYPETKVKGNVGAEVINLSNGEVELHYPEPELPGDTLEAFGVKALFTSRDELSLENGWALRAK
jgi:hypothetical protein